MIGQIYHVIDNVTGQCVKVGSTIRTLEDRWREYDKSIYTNHSLKCVHVIIGADPWHIVASEHLEMLRMRTFRTSAISNQVSPLDQQFFGFIQTKEGSRKGAYARAKKYGNHGTLEGRQKGVQTRIKKYGDPFSPKARQNQKLSPNKINLGKWAVESGHLAKLRTPEHQAKAGRLGGLKGGPIGIKKAALVMGHDGLSQAGKKGGRIGGKISTHNRWHVNRGIIKSDCHLCTK